MEKEDLVREYIERLYQGFLIDERPIQMDHLFYENLKEFLQEKGTDSEGANKLIDTLLLKDDRFKIWWRGQTIVEQDHYRTIEDILLTLANVEYPLLETEELEYL